MVSPDGDPWLAEQLDAAMAPYVGRLPESELAWMRERLAEALLTERRGAELVRRARPRVVEASGTVAMSAARSPGAGPSSSPAQRREGSGRGRVAKKGQ
ncbi:MAG: hypothetical protein R3F14_12465 [Polyangiaceae bacterium]